MMEPIPPGARSALACALSALLLACTAQDEAARPPTPARESQTIDASPLLFTGRRSGNVDLYVRQVPTMPPVRLTTDEASDSRGRLSPDGRRIAFQSGRSGAIDIYLMDADGGNLTNLTDHPAYDVLPVWAPDGGRLAFMSTRGFEPEGSSFPGHVYIVNADGSGLRQVTQEPLTSSYGPQDWSPDGRSLLVSREVGERADLFLLDVDTGSETPLTRDPAGEYGAEFSPDGSHIALHAETEDASQLVVMRSDGTARRTLTSGPGRRYSPRWSPGGDWLLFDAEGEPGPDGEQYDIRAIRVEDGHEVALVVTPEDEREGAWLPVLGSGSR